MKRIIAFVFLGILIYAGIFVTVYGVGEFMILLNDPGTLEMTFQDGLPIEDKIVEQSGYLGQRTTQAALFGAPFGKQTVTYFYVIPVGDMPKYMLIGVTDPEDIKAVENVSEKDPFKFTGTLRSMNDSTYERLKGYLMDNRGLINGENAVYNLNVIAENHMIAYVIYVGELKSPDPVPVIVGAAMILVGAGLAALLTVRIVRERTGY